MDLNTCYYVIGGLVFFIIIMTITFIKHTKEQDKEINRLKAKLETVLSDLATTEYRREYVQVQLDEIKKVLE